MSLKRNEIISGERGVSTLYQSEFVASTYVKERLKFSWQRLLHNSQVHLINQVIRQYEPQTILEIAPGPARLTAEIRGVNMGFLVDYSKEMLKIAHHRLKDKGLDQAWKLIHGNAFELTELKDLPGSIDFIYTFRFIRHFHENDRARLYKAIYAKLSRGGLFMFDVVNRVVREKIDAKADPPSEDSLPIYDATYTMHEFRHEMKNNGFEVIHMMPVINHFPVQSWLSYKFDDLMPDFIQSTVNLIEKIPSPNPLEWIAICKAI